MRWKLWTGPVGVSDVAHALYEVDGVSWVTRGTEHVYFTMDGNATDVMVALRAKPGLARAYAAASSLRPVH